MVWLLWSSLALAIIQIVIIMAWIWFGIWTFWWWNIEHLNIIMVRHWTFEYFHGETLNIWTFWWWNIEHLNILMVKHWRFSGSKHLRSDRQRRWGGPASPSTGAGNQHHKHYYQHKHYNRHHKHYNCHYYHYHKHYNRKHYHHWHHHQNHHYHPHELETTFMNNACAQFLYSCFCSSSWQT